MSLKQDILAALPSSVDDIEITNTTHGTVAIVIKYFFMGKKYLSHIEFNKDIARDGAWLGKIINSIISNEKHK